MQVALDSSEGESDDDPMKKRAILINQEIQTDYLDYFFPKSKDKSISFNE